MREKFELYLHWKSIKKVLLALLIVVFVLNWFFKIPLAAIMFTAFCVVVITALVIFNGMLDFGIRNRSK